MEIFFRARTNNSEFINIKEADFIDINNSVLKIVCDRNIKNLQIGDEKIEREGQSNEFLYYKLRTSSKKTMEVKAVVITDDNKEKIEKKIINIDPDSFIYDINVQNYMELYGEKALNNIIYGEVNPNAYEKDVLLGVKNNIEDIDKIFNAFMKIIKMSLSIIKSPKVELKEKVQLKNSSEVKNINYQSARYFMMHSEDWYREGQEQPKPVKILSGSYMENRDIYENRIVKFILLKCIKIARSIILNLESFISNLDVVIVKDESLLYTNEYVDMSRSEFEKVIQENKKIMHEKKQWLKKMKDVYLKLVSIKNEFKGINENRIVHIRITQKILYDKRYFNIIKLYEEYLSKIKLMSESSVNKKYSIIYSYSFIVSEIICRALMEIGFYDIECSMTDVKEKFFKSEEDIILEGRHPGIKDDKLSFLLNIRNINNMNSENISIDLKYNEEIQKIRFIINSRMPVKNLSLDFIDLLYEGNYDKNYDTTLIINTMDMSDIDKIGFDLKDSRIDAIFKLSTLGNNFLNSEDYKKYGGYREGMIPFSSKEFEVLKFKLVDLLRYKLIEMGCYSYCTYCGIGRMELREQGLLVCSTCGKRVAVNECKNCGEKIIKFLSKNSNESEEDINEIKDYAEYHKKYEIQCSTLGACYKKYFSNSGGFCSYCGKCSKMDSEDCIRCKNIK